MPYHSQRVGSIYTFKQYKEENKQQKNNKNKLFAQAASLIPCIEKNDLKCVTELCQSMLNSISTSSNQYNK